ncbi:Ribokinase-like protein [Pseudomassariella vexata]|uniref:pyridoxal kinase n=1 Tax=Pseudomassariella vexata TaxID=1141098 RepID=A0A1Y2DSQ6_9PEZI|nr:Ribokinase-like protein [Pseudomassariella vexata]ORY62189.1 Ribokinase-like protein [Pseudomassariella vexata]
MGCDVSALNTVQFSNHTGYRQWKGTRVSAEEITDLWTGLRQSYLDTFDMMLSGYVPGAAAVEAVGTIAKELRAKNNNYKKGGGFFWVLDPVMGDNDKLYVADDVVPAYRGLIQHADLILPNQFEAELLSEVKITDAASLRHAIEVLHTKFHLPHIVITSVSMPLGESQSSSTTTTRTMSVVGSTRTSTGKPRLFKIRFPVFDCYFSGTGDMFAALMVVRMREAVANLGNDVGETASWVSGDEVDALDLPLAKAAEKVLASMHEVLSRTCEGMTEEMERTTGLEKMGTEEEEAKRLHLLRSKAAELRLVRNLGCLRNPKVEYWAERM